MTLAVLMVSLARMHHEHLTPSPPTRTRHSSPSLTMSGFGSFFDKVKAQASVAGAQANSMFQVSWCDTRERRRRWEHVERAVPWRGWEAV